MIKKKVSKFQKNFGIASFSLGVLAIIYSIFGINAALDKFPPIFSKLTSESYQIMTNMEIAKLFFSTNLFSTLLIISIILILFGVLFYTESKK